MFSVGISLYLVDGFLADGMTPWVYEGYSFSLRLWV